MFKAMFGLPESLYKPNWKITLIRYEDYSHSIRQNKEDPKFAVYIYNRYPCGTIKQTLTKIYCADKRQIIIIKESLHIYRT
jgi:hypothetical protein